MPDSTASSRIVPDVDQSLTAQHLRHRKRPTLWPLWLCLLLILTLLAAAAAGLWYERERLLNELHRVSGEVSNVHARLDSGDTDVQDTITFVQAQMSTLFQEQEQLSISLADTRDELYSLLTMNEDMASSDSINTLLQQLSQLREQGELRDSQLMAMRESLDALEQTGTSGRQNLVEEITHLEQLTEQRLSALDSQINNVSSVWEEQLSAQREAIEARVDELETSFAESVAEIEAPASQDALETLEQEWSQRLNTLESDVRQVRQSQLAFSAQLEMLR
jgi:DNA anti-recombination protein RmuC